MEDLKEYEDPNKEKKVEENVGEPMNTEKVVEKLIKDEDLSDHTKKRMKKMFRDVMKKTHPDKVKSEELVEIYIKSKEAYELNDLLSLSHYANKLNIEVRLNVVEIKILKDLLSKKKESLEVIESSWLWLWYNSKTKESKKKVVELYYEKHIKQ